MVNVVQVEDWRALIMAYLCSHYEPNSNTELIRMQQRAQAYQVIGEELYKTSIMGPLLRCLRKDEGNDLFAQIHAGGCGGHTRVRALAAKVFRHGLYWTSIIDGAAKLVRTCQACQKLSPSSKAPSQLLGSTVGSWWDRPSALRSARTLNLTQQIEEEDDEQ
jgi:hypothetical protein